MGVVIMKKKTLVNSLISIFLVILAAGFVLADSDLDVDPPVTTTVKDADFITTVDIDTPDSVGAAQFTIRFDPSILEIQSYANGGFLGTDLEITDTSVVDNVAGTLDVVMNRNTPTGMTGQGSIVNVTFKSLVKNGNSDLFVDDITLRDDTAALLGVSSVDNGTVNVVTTEKILINEFLSDPGSGNDWVELYNNDTRVINLSDWQINDSVGNDEIIGNVEIAIGGYYVVDMGNALNKAGDTILLINEEGLVLDQVTYAAELGEDNSSGYTHDGVGPFVIFDGALGQTTQGSANNRITTDTIADKNLVEDVDSYFDVSSEISDLDGDALTFTLVEENDVDCEILNETNVTLSLTANWNGLTNCTIEVDDGYGTVDVLFNIDVAAVNDDPIISGVLDQAAVEDTDLELNVTPYISDVDNDVDTLIVSHNSSYATITDQIITFNYPNNILGEEVTITVSDGSLTAEDNITLTVTPVNDAPVIDSAIASLTFLEGEYLVLNLSDYVSDVDNDDGDIDWSATATTDIVVDIDNTNKMMNISPVSGIWYGSETFTLTADDNGVVDNTDNIDVTVDVQSILSFSNLVVTIDGNDNPANNGDTVGDALADSTFSLTVNLDNNYPTIDEWVEQIEVIAKLDSTIDDELVIGPRFTLNGSKSSTEQLVFDNLPLTIDEGSYTLTINASGTDYKGVVRVVEWTVYVNYVKPNTEIRILDPSLTEANLECFRETQLEVTLVNTGETEEWVNLSITNSDLGINDLLEFTLDDKDMVTYTNTYNWNDVIDVGTYPINIKIMYGDGQGGFVAREEDLDLVIGDCIDVDEQNMDEDSTTPLTLDLGDYVDDPIQLDSYFTYAIESESNTALVDCEIVAMALTCTIQAANATGYSDINLSVIGGGYSNYDMFRLNVNNVNDIPDAYDVSETVYEDDSVNIALSCTDIDDTSLDYIVVSDPAEGVLSGSGDSRTYEPDLNYNGPDSFTYKCNDGDGDSNTATVAITVLPVVDEPYINSSSPTGTLLIGDGIVQDFSITIDDPDPVNPNIDWFVDGVDVGVSGLTYPFSKDITATYEVVVNVTNATDSYDKETWTIDVSTLPVTSYEGTIKTKVNDSNVDAFSGLTIINPNVGMIDFGTEVINLSEVVDVDRYVNISEGVVGIDTTAFGFDVLALPATITMYGLEHDSQPTIYYDSGFGVSGQKECTESTVPSCKVISWNESADTLVFEVDHFTTFFLSMPNKAPRITSSPSETAILEEEYSYTIIASDNEGDTLTYSLVSGPAGMSIASNVVTWTPTNITSENATISVSDGVNTAVTQSWSIDVVEGAKLIISDLDVDVGSDDDKDLNNGDRISEKAKPGDKIVFDIELENLYSKSSDIAIEDIEVTITIKDIDDGDDLDDDVSVDDIDAGKDESVKIDFKVPTLVDEGDYDVIIEVDADDENNNDQDIRWELTLEVNKDNHELLLDDVSISPSLVRCNRNPTIDIELINIGSKDEDDISIEIRNDELGLDIGEDNIELEEGDTDDSVYENIYRLKIDDDVKPGIYPISIKAYYDGKKGDEETVDLTVEDCVDITTPVKIEQPVEVITTGKPIVTKPVQPPVTEITFKDTSEYITILAILFVVLLGAVIFLFMALTVMLSRR